MNFTHNKIITILLTQVVLLTVTRTAFAGLGISPAQLTAPNLTKGSQFEKNFILSRSDSTNSIVVKVVMEGETGSWTTLDKGNTFIIPAGEKRFPITVKVLIPNKTVNGEYVGGIRLIANSEKENTTTDTAALSTLIQTKFNVSEDLVTDYEVTSIKLQNPQTGSPLSVVLTTINKGNTKVQPTKIHVDISDKTNAKILESFDISEINAVEPETKCQGLFSTLTIHCMKRATVDYSTMALKSFLIHF